MSKDRLLVIIIASFVVGTLVGLFYAKWYWTSSAEFYIEQKHLYEYCPYCGEYIG